MATIAALLIVAAVGSLRPAAILEVWSTNWAARVIMLTTLALTLMLPLQYAVLIGVAISTIQYISSASLDVRVRRLVRESEGRFREEDPPGQLPDGEVTVLDIYGSIFYAAADVVADKLPDVRGTKDAVLVLRLRGRGEVRSSAIGLFRRYATELQQGGGALLLAGVGQHMADQLKRTGIEHLLGEHSIFPARSLVYRSTEAAFEEGRSRLLEERDVKNPTQDDATIE
jgi:SulP family sulfate permease